MMTERDFLFPPSLKKRERKSSSDAAVLYVDVCACGSVLYFLPGGILPPPLIVCAGVTCRSHQSAT